MEFLTALLKSMPGAVGQGLIWGIMAIGVYITYRILDVADLTVDGSLATGGATCVLLALNGVNIWIATLCAILAGMLAGLVTGLLHTRCGIPAILAGILTQLALYSVNLRIMGWGTATGTQATLPIRVDNYALLVSSRHIRAAGLNNPLFLLALLVAAVIGAIIYYMVIQVVLRLGLDPNDLKLLTALVVAVFLSIPFWKSQYFTKAVRKGGTSHA